VNWGDSHTETIIGHPSSLQHIYPDNNTTPYTISATAYVADGAASAPATTSVTVNNVAPTFDVTSSDAFGDNGQFFLSLHHNDPGNDTLTWHIDWGDSSPSQTVTEDSEYVLHDYDADNGPYSISVTANDEDNSVAYPAGELSSDGIRVHKLAVYELPRSGKPEELLAKYRIDAAAIVSKVRSLI